MSADFAMFTEEGDQAVGAAAAGAYYYGGQCGYWNGERMSPKRRRVCFIAWV